MPSPPIGFNCRRAWRLIRLAKCKFLALVQRRVHLGNRLEYDISSLDAWGMEESEVSTQLIRQQIASVVASPQRGAALEQRLRDVAQQTGSRPPPSQQAVVEIEAIVLRYIQDSPDLLDACADAAVRAGLAPVLGPLLQEATQYFLAPEDFIPDRFGLYGLLDDSYLVHSLLAQVPELYRQETGTPLLPVNLAPANQAVRLIIGNEMGDQLDQAIESAIQSAVYQTAVAQFSEFGEMMGFSTDVYDADMHGGWDDYSSGTFEDQLAEFNARNGTSFSV